MHPDVDPIYDVDPKDVKEENKSLEPDFLTFLSNASDYEVQ